jgi:hypothetical protein
VSRLPSLSEDFAPDPITTHAPSNVRPARLAGVTLLGATAGFSLLAVAVWVGARAYDRPGPSRRFFAENFDFVGYHDLDGRPAFKLALQVAGERWYLYTSHFWDRGWSVLDVTKPSEPDLVAFVPGPANTATLQIQVGDGLMLTSLEKPPAELLQHAPWQGFAWLLLDSVLHGPKYSPWRASPAGLLVWDVRDPARPAQLAAWDSGGTGTHRNFYAGGRYAHLAASKPGFRGHQYVIIDLADPSHPVEVGDWFLPEQEIAGGIEPELDGYYLHGPPHVTGDRAYLPYGVGGAIILDVADVHYPREVSRLRIDAALGSVQGVHTFLPVLERRIGIINSEAHAENCEADPGRPYAAVVDLSDESQPHILSYFPEPEPPPDATYTSFCERGGRTGPHNQHHDNGLPHLFHSDHLVYVAHFNAGLRLYDTSDPRRVREVGYFMPPDPERRFGVFPTELVAQTEDVIVDARGYAYFTDKNQGLYIVRAQEDAKVATRTPRGLRTDAVSQRLRDASLDSSQVRVSGGAFFAFFMPSCGQNTFGSRSAFAGTGFAGMAVARVRLFGAMHGKYA